jgi:Arc/MetJ-type ribon-helix-helix transcriptional regulator
MQKSTTGRRYATRRRGSMQEGCVIGSKITRSELAQIQDLIDAGVYLNASDFVRDAIRDKLAAIKVIKCRDVDYETAKKEITGYFQRKHEANPDEISQDLEIDFDLVRKITSELKKEGRLEAV